MKTFSPLLLLTICWVAAGCGKPPQNGMAERNPDIQAPGKVEIEQYQGDYPIKVVATTGMIWDLARTIGGVHIDAEALMGAGVDPHLYKASPGDIAKLRGADLILFNGLHLEGKMADVLTQFARSKPTFAVTEMISQDKLREPPEMEGNYDPHLWFDVSLWSECAGFVSDILCDLDPQHQDTYRRNLADYQQALAELHQYTQDEIARIPSDRRLLVTAHDAFGYFGRAYDIEVLAIQGISTESEAGVYKINELVDTIVNRRVKAVFVETSVSDKNIKALVEGCQARGHDIKIGGSLYSDALGEQGTRGGHYLGMVRENVDTIVMALR